MYINKSYLKNLCSAGKFHRAGKTCFPALLLLLLSVLGNKLLAEVALECRPQGWARTAGRLSLLAHVASGSCQRMSPKSAALSLPLPPRSLPLSHAAQFDFLSVRAKDALNIALPASVT